MKFFLASFNRATDGAVHHLKNELYKKNMYEYDYKKADQIISVADRTETYDFTLPLFKKGKPIIHLFAGEISCWSTYDDIWRHSITLMSHLQLCVNKKAKQRVDNLCKAVEKIPNAHVVGNIYRDDMRTNDSKVPDYEYDLVLYNPPYAMNKDEIKKEIEYIKDIVGKNYIWVEPNGDNYSDLVMCNVNTFNLPRPQFLGLMKHCNRFITNSSCQYYESPVFLKPEQIVSIGVRNCERESKYAQMNIPHATENIIEILEEL